MIDLHLHSNSSKYNGDSIKWIGNKEVIKLVYSYGYKMISFTDHSIFDYKQYIDIRDYSNGVITVLPGIEVNIITLRGKIGNILFIFREDLDDEKLIKIQEICKFKLKKSGITHKQSMEIFKDFETIIIPHCGKSDYLEIRDLELINFDALEVTNMNHQNYIRVRKHYGNTHSIVAFSDTHIWTRFPQQDKLVTKIKLDEYTFDNLKLEFKNKKIYVKEKYDKKNNF